jgi:hypothetical protein
LGDDRTQGDISRRLQVTIPDRSGPALRRRLISWHPEGGRDLLAGDDTRLRFGIRSAVKKQAKQPVDGVPGLLAGIRRSACLRKHRRDLSFGP